MKKGIYIAILSVVLLVVGCQQGTTQIENKAYTNTEYGFQLNYPSDWRVGESDDGKAYIVSFEKESEGVVQVWVFYSSLYWPLYSTGLDTFYEESVNAYKDVREEFRILEERDTTIGGLPAKEITFAFTYQGYPRKQTSIVFLGAVPVPYEIVYTPVASNDKHSDDFRLIANSFKFLDK